MRKSLLFRWLKFHPYLKEYISSICLIIENLCTHTRGKIEDLDFIPHLTKILVNITAYNNGNLFIKLSIISKAGKDRPVSGY